MTLSIPASALLGGIIWDLWRSHIAHEHKFLAMSKALSNLCRAPGSSSAAHRPDCSCCDSRRHLTSTIQVITSCLWHKRWLLCAVSIARASVGYISPLDILIMPTGHLILGLYKSLYHAIFCGSAYLSTQALYLHDLSPFQLLIGMLVEGNMLASSGTVPLTLCGEMAVSGR